MEILAIALMALLLVVVVDAANGPDTSWANDPDYSE